MTLDEAITDLESCLAEDWPGEWLNVEALELVLKELKATVMDAHKHHPVYRVGELESELAVARSLAKEALDQVAAKDAALRAGQAACDQFDAPLSDSEFVNGQATAAQQIRAALAAPARKPTGVWPDWGDSPRGFDGPGGAE